MNKNYTSPIVEKITFDYKVQTSESQTECFESVMNQRPSGESTVGPGTQCVAGTPVVVGWTKPQSGVNP